MEIAELFLRNYQHTNEQIDSRLLYQSYELVTENKHVLSQIVLPAEPNRVYLSEGTEMIK